MKKLVLRGFRAAQTLLIALLVIVTPVLGSGASAVPAHAAGPTTSGTWITTQPMHAVRAWVHGVLGPDGQIWAVSGEGALTQGGGIGNDINMTTETLNLTTNQWSYLTDGAGTTVSLPDPQGYATVATVGTRVYALGGENYNNGCTTGLVSFYDITQPSLGWQSGPPLNTARVFSSATADAAGNIFVFGGQTAPSTSCTSKSLLASVEELPMGASAWVTLPTSIPVYGGQLLTFPGLDAASTIYRATDGLIYLTGGEVPTNPSDSSDAIVDSVYSFNPQNFAFTRLGTMLWPDAGHGSAVGSDGRLYVIGGDNGQLQFNVTNQVESWDFSASSWGTAPPMPQPTQCESAARWTLAAVSGPNGYIYAFGGEHIKDSTNNDTDTNASQVFLPGTSGSAASGGAGTSGALCTSTPTVTSTTTSTSAATATPTVTSTPTVSATPTITKTPTETGTPTDTFTSTSTPTVTDTPTTTATPTITETPTITQTPTVTSTPTLAATTIIVTVTAGQTTIIAATQNGQITLQIPTSAIGANPGDVVEIQFVPVSNGIVNAANQVITFTLAITVNNVGITIFNGSGITATMIYDPNQLSALGLDPSNLHIYLQSVAGSAKGQVTELVTTVDLVNHTITATIPHLTIVSAASAKGIVNLPLVLDYAKAPTNGW